MVILYFHINHDNVGSNCLYRITNKKKNKPLIISNQVIQEYSLLHSETVHMKNTRDLLSNQYLDLLLLKHFPFMTSRYVASARCLHLIPENFQDFISKQKIIIKSSLHSLFELMTIPKIIGFCCFNVRFLSLLDWMSMMLQPSFLLYLFYLIIASALFTNANLWPFIASLCCIMGIFLIQILIFLLEFQWNKIGLFHSFIAYI